MEARADVNNEGCMVVIKDMELGGALVRATKGTRSDLLDDHRGHVSGAEGLVVGTEWDMGACLCSLLSGWDVVNGRALVRQLRGSSC